MLDRLGGQTSYVDRLHGAAFTQADDQGGRCALQRVRRTSDIEPGRSRVSRGVLRLPNAAAPDHRTDPDRAQVMGEPVKVQQKKNQADTKGDAGHRNPETRYRITPDAT